MSEFLDNYDRQLPKSKFSKLDEKNFPDFDEDIDAFNDETFGDGSNEIEDWESSHEKMAHLLLERDGNEESLIDDSTLETDFFLRSISHAVLDNDEPEDPAIMTCGKRTSSNTSGGSLYDCHSPILLPFKNSPQNDIWSTSSTPQHTDTGLESILKSLQNLSSTWRGDLHTPSLPNNVKSVEELEQDLLSEQSAAHNQNNSKVISSPFNSPNQKKNTIRDKVIYNSSYAQQFYALPNNISSSPSALPGVLRPAVPASKAIASSPPLPSLSWITATNQNVITDTGKAVDYLASKAKTLDEVERNLLNGSLPSCYDHSPPRLSPFGTSPQGKIASQPTRPTVSFSPPRQRLPQPNLGQGSFLGLPPHPILNPSIRHPFSPKAPFYGNPALDPPKGPPSGGFSRPHSDVPPTLRYIYHPLLNIQKHYYSGGYLKGPTDGEGLGPLSYHRPAAMGDDYEDEYAGLMTQKEKEWLKKIQMLQLHTDNPYTDDYYYTTFLLKKQTKLKQGESKPQVILPETNKHEIKIYEPTQFEKSLGKLQAVNVNYPRKVLDVSFCASTEDTSNYHALRRTLLAIEKMYAIMLEIEDEEKRILALPSNAQGPHLQQKESMANKLHHGLLPPSQPDFFSQVMTIRKGRNLFIRAMPYFNKDQQVSLLEALMSCLSPILKRDAKEKILTNHISVLLETIESFSLEQIEKLVEAYKSGFPKPSSKGGGSGASTPTPRSLPSHEMFVQTFLEKLLEASQNLPALEDPELEEKRSKLKLFLMEVVEANSSTSSSAARSNSPQTLEG